MLDYGLAYLEENKRSIDRLAATLEPEAVDVALHLIVVQTDEAANCEPAEAA